MEEIIGTSNCQTTREDARQLNVALDSSIGIAQVESIDALVAARKVDSQRAHELLQSSLERMQTRSAIHDVHELCVIAALVCLRLGEPAKVQSWAAVMSPSHAGAESKQLSAVVLAFLDAGAGRELALGQDNCEFESVGVVSGAWRQVAGLK